MNVYKRLLNVITFLLLIVYPILVSFYVFIEHHQRYISTSLSHEKLLPLSEEYGMKDEYEKVSIQYFKTKTYLEIIEKSEKLGKVFFTDDEFDELVKSSVTKERYEQFQSNKIEYNKVKYKILEIYKSKRNNRLTIELIIISLGIFLGFLVTLLTINYISFGRFQLIHRFKSK